MARAGREGGREGGREREEEEEGALQQTAMRARHQARYGSRCSSRSWRGSFDGLSRLIGGNLSAVSAANCTLFHLGKLLLGQLQLETLLPRLALPPTHRLRTLAPPPTGSFSSGDLCCGTRPFHKNGGGFGADAYGPTAKSNSFPALVWQSVKANQVTAPAPERLTKRQLTVCACKTAVQREALRTQVSNGSSRTVTHSVLVSASRWNSLAVVQAPMGSCLCAAHNQGPSIAPPGSGSACSCHHSSPPSSTDCCALQSLARPARFRHQTPKCPHTQHGNESDVKCPTSYGLTFSCCSLHKQKAHQEK